MKAWLKFQACTLLLLTAALAAPQARADVVVIVSARSSILRINADQTTKIFLGKTDSFPNGVNAVPIDQADGSSVRNEFYSKVANKRPSQLTAYWAKIIFTGDGYPPKLLEGNQAVKKAVADNPNAIGYINKSTVDSSVRVILEP